jgi:hemerythrin-like domain-containing protein
MTTDQSRRRGWWASAAGSTESGHFQHWQINRPINRQIKEDNVDALEFLRRDHAQLLDLLDRLDDGVCAATPADVNQVRERRDLVTEVVMAESRHETVEEQFFWPAVRRRVPDGERLAEHAVRQEQAAKHVLARLDRLSAGEPEFQRLVDKVIDDGRTHIAYEQDIVWPAVREALSQQELDDLGAQMARAKRSAPTHPHPRTPASPAVQKAIGAVAAVADRARDSITGRARSRD